MRNFSAKIVSFFLHFILYNIFVYLKESRVKLFNYKLFSAYPSRTRLNVRFVLHLFASAGLALPLRALDAVPSCCSLCFFFCNIGLVYAYDTAGTDIAPTRPTQFHYFQLYGRLYNNNNFYTWRSAGTNKRSVENSQRRTPILTNRQTCRKVEKCVLHPGRLYVLISCTRASIPVK